MLRYRTEGGVKFLIIKKNSGFDVVKAVVDLTLGIKPHIESIETPEYKTVNEFVYCKEGEFDHLEGFEELLKEGVIEEFSQFKQKGAKFTTIGSSGDRVAYFSVVAKTDEELKEKHALANQKIRAVSTDGKDLIRHDLIAKF